MSHVVRGLQPGDAAAVRALIDGQGWNRGLHDVETFTAADPDAWIVAEVSGEPVGIVLATRWSPSFGWIGLYLVAPAFRGHGIGLDLFRHALARLGSRSVGLDGDAQQHANYRRSGFRDVHGNARFRGPASSWARPASGPGTRVRSATEADVDPLTALDAASLPSSRPGLLRAWLTQPEARTAVTVDAHDRPIGWALARPARLGWKLGPVLAPDAAMADLLIGSLASQVASTAGADTTLWFDVPATNAAAQELAAGHGFSSAPTSGRMVLGDVDAFPTHVGVFAILAHEVG